ncbi:ABC transporter permease [Petrocella sp. FN5]|uniref:ABC transporter permease n=1 Tax=Petrocella sp. FN5 TaxID=3032002 RepID=UPI0023DB6D15|nr:ABC transporter permease [Petrocella sp. FN5]MDF1615911.1 ABC transporter permease [Petrocella sp. FN5]
MSELVGKIQSKSLFDSKTKQFFSTISGLFILIIIFSLNNENFLTTANLLNVAVQTTPILLIAMGQTYVLITGGIDLSIGSNIALAGVTAAIFMKAGIPIPIAMLLGLGVTAGVGVLNGVMIAYGKLPPFIVTLGTMTTVRGITLTMTQGIPISGLPEAFNNIGIAKTLGIPNPIFIMVIFAVIFGFILSKTRTGRYTYALGSNFEAARLSGVNAHMTLIKVYMFSGILAGVAGLVMAARIISAPPTAGMGYELDAVASSVIGGASTMGGEGAIFGTVVGAFIIGVLRNGLNLMGVSPFIQQIVIGVVIIAAVFFDKLRHSK